MWICVISSHCICKVHLFFCLNTHTHAHTVSSIIWSKVSEDCTGRWFLEPWHVYILQFVYVPLLCLPACLPGWLHIDTNTLEIELIVWIDPRANSLEKNRGPHLRSYTPLSNQMFPQLESGVLVSKLRQQSFSGAQAWGCLSQCRPGGSSFNREDNLPLPDTSGTIWRLQMRLCFIFHLAVCSFTLFPFHWFSERKRKLKYLGRKAGWIRDVVFLCWWWALWLCW